MQGKPQFNIAMHRNRYRLLSGLMVVSLCLSFGCQQPVSTRQGSRPRLFAGLFDRLSGPQQQPTQRSYLGQDLDFPETGNGLQQRYSSINNQLQGMNQKLTAFDSDNQLLNTELAGFQQKLQLANQYNSTLRQELSDMTGRVQQAEAAKQAAVQQLAALQSQNQRLAANSRNPGTGQLIGFNGTTPTGFAGAATLRANNSLMGRFAGIRISGAEARMDGDVIRIEVPTDRLFVPSTYQIQPSQQPLLQSVVTTIRTSFPRQIIGIEAHWDNTPLSPPTTTLQQFTATQALAVYDELVRLGLPRKQIFTMAMANNRPKYSQNASAGVSPNRRIELVIYPEMFDSN
ncbi:MAG: OmpA family protein [Planctomycetota bacterium]